MKDKGKYIIFTAMTVIWMAVIFINSAFDGGESSGLSEMLIDWTVKFTMLFKDGSWMTSMRDFLKSEGFHTFVRKAAHFTEFGILGALSYMSAGAFIKLRDKRMVRAVFVSVFCLFYAITDEVHQLFVPGRCGRIGDVILDFCGALAFIGIMVIADRGKRKNEKKH